MLNMSFYDGTLDKRVLKAVIETTDKPIRYTIGLSYRNPTTNKKPVSKEEAIRIVDTEGWLDATEYDEYILLNSFSDNDMW